MDQKIIEMFEMQESMNKKVHPNWRAQQFEWYRAIWIESAELMEHHGWKWWKKQKPDTEQVKLEIIDIWHFGLSMMLQSCNSLDKLCAKVSAAFSRESVTVSLLDSVEVFVKNTLSDKSHFDIEGFGSLVRSASMTFDDLYCGYMGKNVLNFFRQDHGYKEGTYQKVWNGREDNEHLAELTQSLDHQSASFRDQLYSALEARYKECT